MALRTKTKSSPLDQAHSIGDGALALFEEAKSDLEVAAGIADGYAKEQRLAALEATQRAYSATAVAANYKAKAKRLGEFLS